MKTLKETVDKWNAMYELVVIGATDISNDVWKNMQEVFMLSDEKMQEAWTIAGNFVKDWGKLTEDDIEGDKDYLVWMKCICDLLRLSSQSDYAFCIHDGVVGILNDNKFIPGDEFNEKLIQSHPA